MTASSAAIMPRSPWLASLGCTKKAGVPVEARVAATLRPTWPLLPMPVTITRPRASRISSTAATKGGPAVPDRGGERPDPLPLGFERAQGGVDQGPAALVS